MSTSQRLENLFLFCPWTSAFVASHHHTIHFGINYQRRTSVYHRKFCQLELLQLHHRVQNIGCIRGMWWHHKGGNRRESIYRVKSLMEFKVDVLNKKYVYKKWLCVWVCPTTTAASTTTTTHVLANCTHSADGGPRTHACFKYILHS